MFETTPSTLSSQPEHTSNGSDGNGSNAGVAALGEDPCASAMDAAPHLSAEAFAAVAEQPIASAMDAEPALACLGEDPLALAMVDPFGGGVRKVGPSFSFLLLRHPVSKIRTSRRMKFSCALLLHSYGDLERPQKR
jgi:hypothetical protein